MTFGLKRPLDPVLWPGSMSSLQEQPSETACIPFSLSCRYVCIDIGSTLAWRIVSMAYKRRFFAGLFNRSQMRIFSQLRIFQSTQLGHEMLLGQSWAICHPSCKCIQVPQGLRKLMVQQALQSLLPEWHQILLQLKNNLQVMTCIPYLLHHCL